MIAPATEDDGKGRIIVNVAPTFPSKFLPSILPPSLCCRFSHDSWAVLYFVGFVVVDLSVDSIDLASGNNDQEKPPKMCLMER